MISATLSFTPKFFSGNKDNDLKGNSLIQTSASDFSLKDLSRLFITNMQEVAPPRVVENTYDKIQKKIPVL